MRVDSAIAARSLTDVGGPGGGWREPLGIATLLAAAVGSAGLVRLALRDQPEVYGLDDTPPIEREPQA